MHAKPFKIYVVDDDPGHTQLIVKNLRRSGIENEIEVFHSGPAVLERMHGDADSTEALIMLLDLNMPGMSGHRVLKELKENEQTKHVPIIVLTTTDDAAEIKHCYQLGCNLVLTKPMRYEEFADNMRQLGQLFQIVAPALK